MIALIDYGAGNLTSVKKALAAIDADVYVPAAPEALSSATGVIVPGVGHFAATATLDAAWRQAIRERVETGRPLLGICLGMQWLFEGSDEAPDLPGLGVLAGRCSRLAASNGAGASAGERAAAGVLKVPHVGWNALAIRTAAAIVEGVAPGSQGYFTHSYVAPLTDDTVAVTEHGQAFASIVQRGQVAGVQFHPEKSGDIGLRILRNFIEIAR